MFVSSSIHLFKMHPFFLQQDSQGASPHPCLAVSTPESPSGWFSGTSNFLSAIRLPFSLLMAKGCDMTPLWQTVDSLWGWQDHGQPFITPVVEKCVQPDGRGRWFRHTGDSTWLQPSAGMYLPFMPALSPDPTVTRWHGAGLLYSQPARTTPFIQWEVSQMLLVICGSIF